MTANGERLFLGIVHNEQFESLSPPSRTSNPLRLTRIQPQQATTPETEEIRLLEYEGSAIMVRGFESGNWIFNAQIIDRAGPILTELTRHVLGAPTKV